MPRAVGAPSPVESSQRLLPSERIRRRTDFQQVYDQGLRLHGRLLTIFVLDTGAACARLGVAATKKLGSAVVRNRAKRLLREIFRRNKPTGCDLVVIPRREALTVPFATLEGEFRAVLSRARRIRKTS